MDEMKPGYHDVAQIQRARIIDAMIRTVGERGFAGTTVAGVCERAKVSRATFYKAFDGLEDCFLAVIDEGHRWAQELLSRAFAGDVPWQDALRSGLCSLLALVDDEPLLARVWFVETLAAGAWALEHRSRHIAALTTTITERFPLPEGAVSNPLAPAAVMESILGIVHSRLVTGSDEPFIELLGPLMALISAPYLGADAALVEIARGEVHAEAVITARDERLAPTGEHEPVTVPSNLRDPRAFRVRQCLRHLAAHPGASNREVARAIGITRQEQVSRVLARLQGLGLLVKRAAPPGGANAWSLTPRGMQVTRALPIEYTPACTAPSGGSKDIRDTNLDTYTVVTSESAPSTS
ncbi:MAG TPA: TetR family transcriptional regulator [Steroidobacteraceae bacterium]|nr:TetR family transcriptional regulator [Steroidobacteraceae bacterium]